MAKRLFTDEEAQQLVKEYEAGATLQQLVDKYGSHRGTLSRIIERSGGTIRSRSHQSYAVSPKPEGFDALKAKIFKILPNAIFSEDTDGQIIIHTGLKVAVVEVLTPIE